MISAFYMMRSFLLFSLLLISGQLAACQRKSPSLAIPLRRTMNCITASLVFAAGLHVMPCLAASDLGASDVSNSKIRRGGASTLQKGVNHAITRGVTLTAADFHGEDLHGIAFQQSVVREVNFQDANLRGASFFDADCSGSDFSRADLTLANVELAQFDRAIMKDAVLRELYVVGSTRFDNIGDIENTDWTDTDLRAHQRKYLCSLPSAKGRNPVTQVDTRESLLCED